MFDAHVAGRAVAKSTPRRALQYVTVRSTLRHLSEVVTETSRMADTGAVATRVDVGSDLITWARNRSRVPVRDLTRRFPQLPAWERGEVSPTLIQLEDFANATHTPVGYFFLEEPPVEEVPLPDFRTMENQGVRGPSADLLDTVFQIQQRQEWYRDHLRSLDEEPVRVVGSLSSATPAAQAARVVQEALSLNDGVRGNTGEAFRMIADKAENLGILVMVNGVVGSNTHRKLNPEEFRGFALADDYAPIVFINGADTKAAQNFTLVHEIAHIFLGQTALSSADVGSIDENHEERWCNEVAAEVLVPLERVRTNYRRNSNLTSELERLASGFRVSTLVILRRLYDARVLPWGEFRPAYEAEKNRILAIVAAQPKRRGGNFYNTQAARLSRRFSRAVVASAYEGETLHRDALNLLGIRTISTFQKLAERLGVA